jgi:hypothetical protein
LPILSGVFPSAAALYPRRVTRTLVVLVTAFAFAIAACSAGEPVSTTAATTTSSETTAAESTSTTVASPPAGLYELVEGHDDVGLDRINLIFVPYGWDESDAFVDLAETLLSFDAAPALVDGADLQFGPFTIEPWRSNRDLFNVWYVLDEPAEPVSYTSMGEPFPIDVPDAVVVTLAVDWPYGAASGFTAFIPPELPDRSGPVEPVGLTMSISSSDPVWGNPQILAHELGHAVFGLSDEYVGRELGYDGRPDLSSFPACAEDEGEARAWWGDRLGDVDPMFSIWMDELDDAGLGLPLEAKEVVESRVMVDLVDGGCYGPEGSIRATVDSLMNSNIPVLGTVNRDWAELVLAQYTGMARDT